MLRGGGGGEGGAQEAIGLPGFFKVNLNGELMEILGITY